MRVSIPDGLLLLSSRAPLADCSRELYCWSLHVVSEWLELVYLYAEASEDLPQACMTDCAKHLLEVYGVVEQIALAL